MTHFEYLSRNPTMEDEDLAQEAWCKALSRTDHRPDASTPDELIDNYQHIAGLVTHIFRHEKIKTWQQPKTVPLTNEVGIVYNREDALEDCTPQQLDAIRYYVSVIDQGRPLSVKERAKLKRLRKATGLALKVPKYQGG